MNKVLRNKDFEAVTKCMKKNCSEYKSVADAQAKLFSDIRGMLKDKANLDPHKLIQTLQKFKKVEKRRELLVCTLQRCSDEVATLILKATDAGLDEFAGAMAMLKAAKKGRKA